MWFHAVNLRLDPLKKVELAAPSDKVHDGAVFEHRSVTNLPVEPTC